MVDVFISYSRDNKARVADIAKAITAAGYAVWWDAELPPHRSYGDVITEKIGEAKAAVVVWSQASAQSEWVRAEADVARNQKKLIQTAIDDIMPPLPFNQIQFADLQDWHGETDHRGWSKVLMSLEELCGRPPIAGNDKMADGPARPPSAPAVQAPASSAPPASAPSPARKESSSFLPWALLGLALIAVALLAWKLTRPSIDGNAVVAADSASGASAANTPAESGVPAAVRSEAAKEAFVLAAVINDPEGFTNIRSGQGTQHGIIGKIVDGEKFLTYRQSGSWWRVRKSDGTTGYMFRKYIDLIEDGAAVMPGKNIDTSEGAIIADSSKRRLTNADVAGLGADQLRLARNEIFARKGMRFKDADLAVYFEQFRWYEPTRDAVQLSTLEKANIALLRSAEATAQ